MVKKKDDVQEDEKSMKEEQPLEELTHGELNEVEKLKAWQVWLENRKALTWQKWLNKQKEKKPWHDGTITFDNLVNAFNIKTGKKNTDATGSDKYEDSGKARAVLAVADTIGNNPKTGKSAQDIKGKQGKHNETIQDAASKLAKKIKKTSEIISKISMGDPNKANQHETSTSLDPEGDIVDDKQIYIGKPSEKKQGKQDEQHTQ